MRQRLYRTAMFQSGYPAPYRCGWRQTPDYYPPPDGFHTRFDSAPIMPPARRDFSSGDAKAIWLSPVPANLPVSAIVIRGDGDMCSGRQAWVKESGFNTFRLRIHHLAFAITLAGGL